jgi:hypothetical protein
LHCSPWLLRYPHGGKASPHQVPSYITTPDTAITTPDTVDTRIRKLKFFDGLPDAVTVRKVYDNLDFVRASKHFSAAYQPHRSMQHAKVSTRLG